MRFLVLASVALCGLVSAQAGDNKAIKVKVDQEFKVMLRCNLSTAYEWQMAKPPDGKLVKLLGSEFRRADAKRIGAGGDMVWTFRALAEGKAGMELSYVRPWERRQKPTQTTNFVVVIEAGKGKAKKGAASPGN